MITVFVYLGPELPKYVFVNAQNVAALAGQDNFVFIVDELEIFLRLRRKGINSYLVKNDYDSKLIRPTDFSHNPGFRNMFWYKSFARFLAIYEFSQNYPNRKLLHIESDVFLFPNFPFEKIRLVDADIAFPMSTPSNGIPSTILFRDSNIMKNFVEFAKEQIESNSNSTDVSILGEVSKSDFFRFEILPSLPKLIENSKRNVLYFETQKLSSNWSNFGGVFDSSTWGQYLTGIDPRNTWGIRKFGLIQTDHSADPSLFKYKFVGANLIGFYEDFSFPIFSLHVHSKDIRFFCDLAYRKRLVSKVNKGSFSKICFLLMIRLLPSRLKFISKQIFSKTMKR